jgi:hypothetical protein
MTTTTATQTETLESLQGTETDLKEAVIPEKGLEAVKDIKNSIPITPDQLELIERYRELAKLKAPFEVEQKAIAELITNEMKASRANKLTRNGVVEVELIRTSRTSVDSKGLIKLFPRIAERFMSITHGFRFDAKK